MKKTFLSLTEQDLQKLNKIKEIVNEKTNTKTISILINKYYYELNK
jgi:hypothetical protein